MRGALRVTLTVMTLLRVTLTVTLRVTVTVMRTSGPWQDVRSRRINRTGRHKDNTDATQHMVMGTPTNSKADKLFLGQQQDKFINEKLIHSLKENFTSHKRANLS